MTGMGSLSARCHPPFPRPGNNQRSPSQPVVIAVTSLVTSLGTVWSPRQRLAPGRHRETCCQPHRPSKADVPWWAALATPGGLYVDCELDGQACRALVDTGSNITLVRPWVLRGTKGVLSAA